MAEMNGVIGAGNWLVDRIMKIDRWPGEGNLCNISDVERASGGGPANVLFDLAAMTREIPLFAAGSLGDDDSGIWLREEAARRGINTDFLHLKPGLTTSFTDVMSGGGKRTFFHCRGANAAFSVEDVAEMAFPARIFYLGYLLLLDRLDAADPEFGTQGARLLSLMRRKGCFTVVDMVSEAPEKFRSIVLPALPHIDALVVNELEAGCAFGITVRRPDGSLDREQMRLAAGKFLENGVRSLVVLHYPEGAYAVSASGEDCEIASFDVRRIVGTNGAGDAFCAGVVYAIHEKMTLKEMLRWGSASSAFNLTCASASGGAVSVERLRQFLASEGAELR